MNSHVMAWAARHGVTHEALQELQLLFGMWGSQPPPFSDALSESGVQSRVRLAAARAGYLVWRNNVGAMQDAESGRVVRFGLANESKAENEQTKSSDLVGVKPGGQFWCRECKPVGWIYTATPREVAQLNYIQLVNSQGGDAAFTTGAI